MAGLGLYAMGWCGFERAQVYSIAANKQTANVLFKDATAMCRAPIPDYDDGETPRGAWRRRHPRRGDNAHKIEHPATGSFFLPLAGGEQQSGPRPRMVLGRRDPRVHHRRADPDVGRRRSPRSPAAP
jgi:hypothetical protein